MKFALLFFGIVLSFVTSQAQDEGTKDNETTTSATEKKDDHMLIEPDSLGTTKSYQTEKIQLRKFDPVKWKQIVGSADYNEMTKKKSAKKVQPLNIPWSGEAFRLISYAVILIVVGLLIYYVSKNILIPSTLQKKMLPSKDFVGPVEHIEALDLQTLLRQALSEGNLKNAMRVYYLGLLKKLNETGMIVWKKDKTNLDYLAELVTHGGIFEEVRILTVAYEHFWYGDHHLTTASFENLVVNFKLVDQRLNTRE